MYTYLCIVGNERMPYFSLQACLQYFSLCPHLNLPPSLASFLLEHRTHCLQRKTHTLSCPTSAPSRTLMSKLLHMDSLACLTYSLRRTVPNHNPTPPRLYAISIQFNTIQFSLIGMKVKQYLLSKQ